MSWIVDEVTARGGEVSFRDYMELALYHPAHGYYSAHTPRYGRAGDYLTAPTASTWYASVVGRWLNRLADRIGPLTLLDVAAGDGSLIAALLSLQLDRRQHVIREVACVERSPSMRATLERRVRDLAGPRAVVAGSIGELGHVAGPLLIHACELYDALPVHRVVMREHGLQELRVVVRDGECCWREVEAALELEEYFAGHGVRLAPGQIAEACLEAERLHRELLQLAGDDAVAVVVDYGYDARRLYDPRGRRGGSLAVYRSHRVSRDPLEEPGERDLTSHVNWDDLRRAAVRAGWRELGLRALAVFLVECGIAEEMERAGVGTEADLDAGTVADRQEIKRLLDPDGMGADLKVLIQGIGPLADAAAEDLGARDPGLGRR